MRCHKQAISQRPSLATAADVTAMQQSQRKVSACFLLLILL